MFRSYQPQQPCSWAWSCPHTGTAAGPAGPGVRRPAHNPEQNIAEAAAQAVPGCMNTNHHKVEFCCQNVPQKYISSHTLYECYCTRSRLTWLKAH